MTRRGSWEALTARNMLAGLAALSVTAPAFAERAVQLTYRETPGYARIIAKWSDGDETAPKITATVSNQVLVLSFDQPVTVDIDALREGLPSWASITRMDADGRAVRVGLLRAPRVRVQTSVDLTAVDLMPEAASADPPRLVSPLVAVRAAEEAARRAAETPPPAAMANLDVRGSHTGGSSRVAFYWDSPASYRVVDQGPGMLKLQFSRQAETDLAYMRISPPENLAGFETENTRNGFVVTLKSRDGLPLRHFDEAGTTVVGISRAPPQAEPVVEKTGAKPAEKPAEPKPEPKIPIPPEAPRWVQSLVSDPLTSDLPVSLGPRTPGAPAAAPQAAAGAGAAANAIGGGRSTVMAPAWTDTAPPSGIVDVAVSPLVSGVELQATFAAPTPAAVFARGSAVWAVFAANADLKVDAAALPSGFQVRTLRGQNATMMRIEGPRNFTVSAEAEDATWRVRLAPSALRPQRFLQPERRADRDGYARVETMIVGAAGIVWFEDSAVGDLIAAAVSYGPSSASATTRDFVEASMPATAHGLAISPRSDSVQVTLEGERVVVAMAGGSAEPMLADIDEPPPPPVNPAFVDFATWGGLTGEAFFARRTELEHKAAELDPATADGAAAHMELARFYTGHELALEALGVMRIMARNRPEVRQDPRFLGLRGAANVMANRLETAENDLTTGDLRGDPSAAIWRALIAARRGEWERATDHMRVAGGHVYAYPPAKSAAFTAAFAEAALFTNDYDTARKQAEITRSNGQGEDIERAELVLATLSSIIQGHSAAYAEFERLSNETSEPVAVRAELKRLEAGVGSGKMTANDAAAELESLRFRWRGDGVEMATVGILSEQYMRVGRFRDALLLAQSAARRDPAAPGARDLRIRLTEYFKRLYLQGEADRLDPIQALALFYEFADSLTPIGTDGDLMIRKLAQRLVAFDLLEPAAQLLQHQVDNRMRGLGKASIAVDLATIYLADKRPDRALAAINTTRQPQLGKELALQRRLIEAAAYRDMGRFEHVIELTEGVDSPDARSLLADAHWRSRNWAQAGRAYLAMLPPVGEAKGKINAGVAFRAAIAARLARGTDMLAAVRGYGPVLEGDPNKASFDLITSHTDANGAALSEAVRRVADAPRVDAFAAAMMKRFESTPVLPPASAPAETAPAAPAQQAAPPPDETAATGAGGSG